MVKALWGKCDGVSITFAKNQAGRWETAVPASRTGAYILELWAEDYAGNVGYFATVRVTFDPSQLCVRVEILDVGAAFTLDEVRAVFRTEPAAVSPEPPVRWRVRPDPVKFDVVRCEVCGA